MILKSLKQLFTKIKSLSWDGAGSGRRLCYFQPERGSINSLLAYNLETLRIVVWYVYAANIIDTIVSNCVGTGIKPQSKAKDAEFRKKLQQLWLNWTDEADSNGVNDFYGL
ncbi:MAG: hypothetical protein sL5_09850 [Candidatus Mesenet longicola]|uniref:Phage portal protein n=1 Tax=Candidatus Mesenet longicola TaxID=1892558 RepID=A0A8J3HVE2_9RICK|nr:MAG: hypothetical protein sGL2_10340 [Candidatus Mesenet longicola]GHM59992.1 MAG: hypothetical protein sL5_09850 [Candidatus Mesenet longicola]